MNHKLLQSILSAKQDNNIKFKDLRILLQQLGFNERINGDHFIYKIKHFPERINIQPDGNMAKTYRIRQIRGVILKYNLGGNDDD
ncbi:MAG: type II toxin-antitoxin system HicA family toxin [Oscillospiraceae bacterium]|nr:type II toxin-antitoxin system HicA family toxin [Oscillospiraceae bacterium]